MKKQSNEKTLDDFNYTFKELREKLHQKECFEKPSKFPTIAPIFLLILQVLLYYFTISSNNIFVVSIGLTFIVLLTIQIFYVSHDAGHNTISSYKNINLVYGLLGISLVGSGSFMYWKTKHYQHHKYCNQKVFDPDISALYFKFYDQPINKKNKLIQYNIKYQHYTVWIWLLFYWIEFRRRSWVFIIKNIDLCKFDCVFIILHICVYLLIPYFCFGNFFYLLIYWCMWTIIGLVLGPIFAVNHVGMPISEEVGFSADFRQQIESSRNIKISSITSYAIWGGLNYQIEHHIFPNMHRSKYKLASLWVKEFCKKNRIIYKELSFLEAVLAVFKYMKLMSDEKTVYVEKKEG